MLGVCIHGHLYVYYVFISFYLQSLLIQFVPSYSRKTQLLECCPFTEVILSFSVAEKAGSAEFFLGLKLM